MFKTEFENSGLLYVIVIYITQSQTFIKNHKILSTVNTNIVHSLCYVENNFNIMF